MSELIQHTVQCNNLTLDYHYQIHQKYCCVLSVPKACDWQRNIRLSEHPDKHCPGFSCPHLFILPIFLLSSLSWNVFLPLFLHSLFSSAVLLKGCSTDIHIQTMCQSMAYFLPLLKIHIEIKSKHLKLSRQFHIAITFMQVFTVFLKVMEGTSLVVQWLRVCLAMWGMWVWIPGWRTKIPHATKQLSLWTTARAHMPQLLNPHTLEPTSHN